MTFADVVRQQRLLEGGSRFVVEPHEPSTIHKAFRSLSFLIAGDHRTKYKLID